MLKLTPVLIYLQVLIFDEKGLLPAGDYEMTFEEVGKSILINNPDRTDWDSQRRLTLLGNFQILTEQLWNVGIDEVYIAGSFVEEKDRPNDIDGYFVADFNDIVNKNKDGLKGRLRAQESRIWTWDRADLIYVPEIGKKALPMRVKYDVEMYPDYPGAFSGIRDRRNNPLVLRQC